MNVRHWFSALALTAGVTALGFGSRASAQVSGTVKLEGAAPEMPVVDMSGKAECAEKHKGQTVHEQTIVVGAKGGLKNVVVSINTPDGVTLPPIKPTEPAALTQKGCMYEPHVLAMQVGQKLVIKNDDAFMHNVDSQSPNVPFNFAQPNIDPGKAAPTPKQAEYFHVKCDVHPWMSAYIAVMDNGYFAVTKEDGTFEIPKGLPDGDYAITAWHEKLDKQDGTVTVKDGKGTVDFSFKQESAGSNPVPVPAKTALAQAKTPAADDIVGCGCPSNSYIQAAIAEDQAAEAQALAAKTQK